MKEKIKKVSIVVLTMIVSIVSLAISPLTVSTIYAMGTEATIEATETAIEASWLVWNLFKSTLNATNNSDILDNEDTREQLFDIVNDVLMSAGGSNFMESPAYEAYKKQYPELAAMVGTGTIWNPAPTVEDTDDVISWDNWHKDNLGNTQIWDPNEKSWELAPDVRDWKENPVVLTPEQQKEYGLDTNYWKTGEELLKEIAKKNGWLNKDGGGSGGSGGDSGDSGNTPQKGTKVKIGTGILASMTALVVSLTSGKTGNSTIDSYFNAAEKPIYDGTYQYDTVTQKYKVSITGSREWDDGSISIYEQSQPLLTSYKEFIYLNNGRAYLYCIDFENQTWSTICDHPSMIEYVYDSTGKLKTTREKAGWNFLTISSISANIPIFNSEEGFVNFCKTGDDSTCINKEQKKLLWADVKSMAAKLPSTFKSLTDLPQGKVLNTNVLKDFNDSMANYKKTASPDDLTNPDTQTQVATKTMQESVTQNTVDEKEKEDTKPVPLPDYPTPDKITIDGSEATRDWRLVFPFCIPFDIIDLYRCFVAEPEAPYWEIPLKVDTLNFEYTFVIDLSKFETIAEIFRTFEIILFILGLAMITSKVIKW